MLNLTPQAFVLPAPSICMLWYYLKQNILKKAFLLGCVYSMRVDIEQIVFQIYRHFHILSFSGSTIADALFPKKYLFLSFDFCLNYLNFMKECIPFFYGYINILKFYYKTIEETTI